MASEIVEFKEGDKEIRETVNRVVELGLAYRVEVIQNFLAEVGVSPTVSSDSVEMSDELG